MIKITSKGPETYKGEMIVFFVREDKDNGHICTDSRYQKQFDLAFGTRDFVGKKGQSLLFYPDSDKEKSVERVCFIGLGKDDFTEEDCRIIAGNVVKTVLKTKARKIYITSPEVKGLKESEIIESLTEGLILANYTFDKYKSDNNEKEGAENTDSQPIKEIFVYPGREKLSSSRKWSKKGRISAEAGCFARDMANEPGNYWTPQHFADAGVELAEKHGLSCKVITNLEMKKLGMGGILGVNQGSDKPCSMTILNYQTNKKNDTLMLVGKGLTFDSGGISLKSGAGMQDMKYDMCGGAAVLAAMDAVGQEKPKGINVIGLIPATENMPGAGALKPGDIITQYGGKTVEIINTDAEGRLILADALAYGIEAFNPDAVIDLATLTGAVIVGLGHHRTGLLSNDDQLAEKILKAGEKKGEALWRLPLGEEYTKQLKSQVADIQNIGKRAAGTITGACFLEEFIGEVPWAHLDIAGTAWNFTDKSYIPKGPSGTGTRTLVEIIRSWKSN
jgi:leucyl aminopeptidase